MDGFGDNFVPNGESSTAVDPAAEFLAREQDELAGLEDVPVVQTEPETVPQVSSSEAAGDFSPSPFLDSAEDVIAGPETVPEVSTTSEGTGGAPAANTLDSPEDLMAGTAPATDDALTAVAPQPLRTPERVATPVPRVEPEAIRIWREEHHCKLVEKDVAEERAKDALREKAKQELADWYKQHDEQVAKTRQANRCAEKELVADTERPEPGTEWERIAKLCDFNPKTAKSSRDVSRMRSIILHVKQSPPVKA